MLKLIAATTFFAANAAPLLTPAPLAATLPYLKAATLQTLDDDKRKFQAEELWENNGAVIYAARRSGCQLCRAAAMDLSSLQPEIESRNMKLFAVVHEDVNTQNFKQFFKGDVFLDINKTFYGPQQRWQHGIGFISIMSCFYVWKAIARRLPGEKDGEGRLLGATFVIGPGDQGVVYQHNEFVSGHEAKLDLVEKALQDVRIKY